MKKIILSSVVCTMLTTAALAEMEPYIGISSNSFTITNSNLRLTNTNTGVYSAATSNTEDSGSGIGIQGGLILDDSSKVNISYFSEKEDDSKVMTATVITASYDYNFNNFGEHQGIYIGAGLNNVNIEFDNDPVNMKGNDSSSTNLLLKLGFEYKLGSFMLDVAYNYLGDEQDHSAQDNQYSYLQWTTTTDITSTTSISINYIF